MVRPQKTPAKNLFFVLTLLFASLNSGVLASKNELVEQDNPIEAMRKNVLKEEWFKEGGKTLFEEIFSQKESTISIGKGNDKKTVFCLKKESTKYELSPNPSFSINNWIDTQTKKFKDAVTIVYDDSTTVNLNLFETSSCKRFGFRLEQPSDQKPTLIHNKSSFVLEITIATELKKTKHRSRSLDKKEEVEKKFVTVIQKSPKIPLQKAKLLREEVKKDEVKKDLSNKKEIVQGKKSDTQSQPLTSLKSTSSNTVSSQDSKPKDLVEKYQKKHSLQDKMKFFEKKQ
jgi:hypothetical protein